MRPNNPYPTAEVLGISVNAIDMPLCLDHIADLFAQPGGHYICVAGVHGVMEAQRDPELFDAYRDAAMTVPDGMPLVWTGWLQNHPHMARVAGPDLMVEVLRDLQASPLPLRRRPRRCGRVEGRIAGSLPCR
jgi:N-acetylglucosaminyldiphosphoundecaprenol N-acetyl-beta-D-mannosaminyltransferase